MSAKMAIVYPQKNTKIQNVKTNEIQNKIKSLKIMKINFHFKLTETLKFRSSTIHIL